METEAIIAAGCILAEIPLVDRLEVDPVATIRTGDWVEVDAISGLVKVRRRVQSISGDLSCSDGKW